MGCSCVPLHGCPNDEKNGNVSHETGQELLRLFLDKKAIEFGTLLGQGKMFPFDKLWF